MNNFSVTERQVGDVTVLDIQGKLKGCGGAGMLRDAIKRPLGEGRDRILLNLARVSDIDSSCLGELIASHAELDKTGGQLKIAHLSRNLREMMMFTKLSTVFNIHGDEAEALKSFGSPPFRPAGHRPAPPPDADHAPRTPTWGAPGTGVTVRAELMQNRSHLLRSFSVKELLPDGRVTLNGIHGEFDRESLELVRGGA
jgi:anti-sigma B factor antagonist